MKNPKNVIVSTLAPAVVGPYSQAIQVDQWIYVSGQIGLDPATGALVPGGVAEQTGRVIRNLGAVLNAAGIGLESVVKTTVYMTDLGQFNVMNEVYAKHFTAPPPARATVQVAALPKGALVEIEAVAYKKNDGEGFVI